MLSLHYLVLPCSFLRYHNFGRRTNYLSASIAKSTKVQLVFYVLLGLYLIQAISAVAFGINAWDEETDLLGIRSHIAHAASLLTGRESDYRSIHSNLEYYGTIGFAPAWIFWFLARFVSARLSLEQALYNPAADHQLTSYYQISHVFIVISFLLLVFLVIKTAGELRHPYPHLAGCIILLMPSLVGHSFVNAKDITFCTLYTAYTLCTILRLKRGTTSKLYLVSILIGGLLVNSKFVFLLPLVLTELAYTIIARKNLALMAIFYASIRSFLSLLIALAIQPASWLVNPYVYLHEAFLTFSTHQWGGCMSFHGSCVGRYDPGWSTLFYISRWMSAKIPLLVIFLLCVTLLFLVIRTFRSKSFPLPVVYLPVLAQLLIIPVLSVFGNSNLYDTDRHLLFIYPPLVILSLECTRYLCHGLIRKSVYLVAIFLSIILLADNLLITPYGTAYFNEPSRFFLNHENTATDYWATSAKEAINKAQLNGSLPVNPVLSTGLWISPLWISFRQLAGQMNASLDYELQLRVRNPSEFSRDDLNCRHLSTVSRNLLFISKPLVLSRLELCKKLSG